MASLQNLAVDFANSNPSSIATTGALLAPLFHLSISRLEFERYIFHFLAFHVISFLGASYNFATNSDHGISIAIAKSILLFTTFNTGLLASIAVYRLFFHRCHPFPGPFLARLSRFYALYVWTAKGPFYKQLEELHREHGDIVRTGPRELSILNKAAIPLLYGPSSPCQKSTWYTQSGTSPTKVSINQMRDQKQYRLRRRAWDRGFSVKALASYEPRVIATTELLIARLSETAGAPVDVAKWATLYSFDVMGKIGFGADFGNLRSGQQHPALRAIAEHMDILGMMQNVPWLLNLLNSVPGAARGFSGFFELSRKMMGEKMKMQSWVTGFLMSMLMAMKTLDPTQEPKDVASWLLKAVIDHDISASPTPSSLADDSRVLIIAGSDTTATTLANAIYFLTLHLHTQRTLHHHLDTAFPNGPSTWTYATTKQIAYLDAIIDETLRLKPPLPYGGPRETPPQGLHMGSTYIPGSTNVSVPYLLIQRDPRYWGERADEFVPERWDEAGGKGEGEGAPWVPFTLGLHACVGKGAAYLTLRTVLSMLFLRFEASFAEGEGQGEGFEDFGDGFLMAIKPLRVVLRERKRGGEGR